MASMWGLVKVREVCRAQEPLHWRLLRGSVVWSELGHPSCRKEQIAAFCTSHHREGRPTLEASWVLKLTYPTREPPRDTHAEFWKAAVSDWVPEPGKAWESIRDATAVQTALGTHTRADLMLVVLEALTGGGGRSRVEFMVKPDRITQCGRGGSGARSCRLRRRREATYATAPAGVS